jgi:Family of unknown function (DUF6084)
MPDLGFKVEDAAAVQFAVVPTIALKLRITNADPEETIHTIALRCQIQIDVTHRRYTADEQAQMRDLFGEPERWSQTLRSLLWTHVSIVVPSFRASTLVDLPIHCTFDFNVGATKYFEGLRGGEIPLVLLFSGTIFYADSDDVLQVMPISWSQEARFRLPVKVWRDMMDAYYPNTAWLNLRRDVFDRLYQYKTQRGIPTWEQALESVLPVEETVNS